MSKNKKLECLINLQEVLQKKFVLEDQIASIPAELREKEAALNAATMKNNELKESFDNLTSEQKSLAIRYDDAFNQRIEYEKQMEFITTQREYEALTKQLDEAKSNERALLKQRNSKTLELEKLQEELSEQEALVAELQAVVNEEKDKVDDQIIELRNRITTLEAECNDIKEDVISDDLYEKFSNIVRKKDGYGIVPVKGQVCTGCDLILPMQFVIDLEMHNLNDEIEYCPYCSRIIYKAELDAEEEASYIFEQLEPTKSDRKSSGSSDRGADESFDESMEMGDGFEDF